MNKELKESWEKVKAISTQDKIWMVGLVLTTIVIIKAFFAGVNGDLGWHTLTIMFLFGGIMIVFVDFVDRVVKVVSENKS